MKRTMIFIIAGICMAIMLYWGGYDSGFHAGYVKAWTTIKK